MDAWATLLGIDPSGPQIAALCALEALVLAAIILGGFVWLRHVARRGAPPAPNELGLLTVWRLHRDLRRGSDLPDARQVSTAPLRLGPRPAARPDSLAEAR